MPLAAARLIEAPMRLEALRRSRLLDSPPEETFDRLTRLAAGLLHAPVSLLSLVDRDRQFFKSAVGLSQPWASARETPLTHSFCQHVVAGNAPFVVEDARDDPLVADNQGIQDLGVIAYAGIPLRTRDGETIGSLCVIDHQPRHWTAEELAIIEDLAGAAMTGIELHSAAQDALEIGGALESQRNEREALLDATAEGICGVDREGRCTFVNRAGTRLLGSSREELIGKDLHESIHHTRPDGRPYLASDCAIVRTLREGVPVRSQQELLWRADGSSFLADYSAFPIMADDAIGGAVVTFTDVSERQADQRLLSTQYSVGRVLAEAGDMDAALEGALRIVGGLWHWDVGLAWLHDEGTDRLVVRSSWQGQDSPSIDAFITASRAVSLRRDEGLVGDVWRTGEPASMPDITGDPRYLRRDLAAAAGFRSALVLPVRAGSRRAGVIELCSSRDGPIDEKIVEAAEAVALQLGQYLERLRTEEALMVARRAIGATTTGITISDPSRPDNPLIYVNRAFTEITGYDDGEVMGRNCRFLQGPETDPAAVEEIRRAIREARACRVVLLNYRKDKTPFWNDLSISPVAGPDGRVTHFIGVQTDATERISNEDRLRTATRDAELANAAKSIFLANVSHELRTPLNAVIGYSELLQEESVDLGADTLIPDLQKINVAGRHLLSLINDVLDLAKIEAGRMELDLRPVKVTELVHDVQETIAPLIQQHGNHLIVDCAVDTTIEADATKLRQALLNLLSNAAKFTDHGEVSLTIERTDRNEGELEFRVRDTGIGLTDEEIQRLFAPFSQAGASVAGTYGGTGLGLALTRDMIQLMGGDVSVQSVPGEGSLFSIRIPYREFGTRRRSTFRKAVDVQSFDVQTDGGSAKTASGRTAVLVIDDDPSVGRLLGKTLAPDYTVVSASTGPEGLAMAARIRPLAVVLDVVMPHMTGWDILARLKGDPGLAHIPVVVLTMVDDRRRGRFLGADEFMTKPVDSVRIRRVLDRYRRAVQSRGRVLLVSTGYEIEEIRQALEQDGWDVEQAGNADSAIGRLTSAPPDVVLIDLACCGASMSAVLKALPNGANRTAVIALAPAELDAATREALAAGATTVIERSTLSLAAVLRRIGARADMGSLEEHRSKPARRGATQKAGKQR